MGFYKNLCPGCMNEIGDAEICPYCEFDTKNEQTAPFLAYGTVLAGKYVVGDVLERNSEGVTYLGLDTMTNNCVRIREFLPEILCVRQQNALKPLIAENDVEYFKGLRTDFLNLWHKVMKLKTNDALITVLDVFEANDTAYAIAEADGSQTLNEYIDSNGGILDWNTITAKLFPVLDAVEALHNEGVIHGAISPDTLFLCDNGNFKLWGFSINEVRQADGRLATDIRHGYAAIEQYSRMNSLTEATDVYGFIATLYKCITGSMPIDAKTREEDDYLSIPAVYARELSDYVLAAFISALQVSSEERTQNIPTFKASFTKEAFESKIKANSMLTGASLIDPISDFEEAAASAAKTAAPVVITTTPDVPVLSKKENDEKSTSATATIILSISIVAVMLIFFACLALTGIVTFNIGGTSASVVEMPDFSNYRKDDPYIVEIANNYGLQITLNPASSTTVAKDVIFEQDIAPGTKIAKGSKLVLTYSKGASTVTLPDFTGAPFTETVYYIGKLNLSYNIVEKANNGQQKAGHVASMNPAAGSVVLEGQEIIIEIWGEPEKQSGSSNNNTTTPSGSQIIPSDSMLDSIFGSLSDSVSGLGETIQSFF